jgi:hypothetical protein
MSFTHALSQWERAFEIVRLCSHPHACEIGVGAQLAAPSVQATEDVDRARSSGKSLSQRERVWVREKA